MDSKYASDIYLRDFRCTSEGGCVSNIALLASASHYLGGLLLFRLNHASNLTWLSSLLSADCRIWYPISTLLVGILWYDWPAGSVISFISCSAAFLVSVGEGCVGRGRRWVLDCCGLRVGRWVLWWWLAAGGALSWVLRWPWVRLCGGVPGGSGGGFVPGLSFYPIFTAFKYFLIF